MLDVSKDRARLRADLNARAARRDARALDITLRAERKADRAENKRARVEARRAALKIASYALDASEIAEVCATAAKSAGVPQDARSDVSQALALEVMRRHGIEPDRAAIGTDWLRTRANAHFLDSLRATERATGQVAASKELASDGGWVDSDPVYAIAVESHNVIQAQPLTAERIAASLPALTNRQRETVCTWLGDRAEPLTNLERQHFHAAMGKLRSSSPAAIRRALRDDMRYASDLVDRAIVAEQARADVASRGC